MVELRDKRLWEADNIVDISSLNCLPLDSFKREKYLSCLSHGYSVSLLQSAESKSYLL